MSEIEVDEEPTQVPVREEVKRSSGIGGSEIAAVVGLNPYTSPFDVWLEKTGQAVVRTESAPMRWGKLLQRAIAGAYEEDTGRTLVVCFDEPRRHPQHQIVIGTPDALAPEEKTVIELKAPGARQAWRYGEPGSDQVPDEHLLQCQWYMSLLDYDRAGLAVLFGGQQFRIYQIQRDRALEDALLTQAEKFWRVHVMAMTPPAITDTERSREYLRRAFPKNRRPFRKATEDEALLAWAYHSARTEREKLEKQESDFAAQLKLSIADAEGLEGSGFRLSYRAAKDSEVTDWKAVAQEYRNTLEILAELQSVPTREAVRRIATEAIRDAQKFTTTKSGSRRFLPRFEGEE